MYVHVRSTMECTHPVEALGPSAAYDDVPPRAAGVTERERAGGRVVPEIEDVT